MCLACISCQHSKYAFPKKYFFSKFSIIFTWRHTEHNCQSHYWKFTYRQWFWYLLESYAIKKFCWNRHRKSLDFENINVPFTSLHWFQFSFYFLLFYILLWWRFTSAHICAVFSADVYRKEKIIILSNNGSYWLKQIIHSN